MLHCNGQIINPILWPCRATDGDRICTLATTGEVAASTEPSNFQDAVASLMTLGYKPADADKLVRKAVSKLDASASVELLLREALS